LNLFIVLLFTLIINWVVFLFVALFYFSFFILFLKCCWWFFSIIYLYFNY
jgi:hypothetical protein